MDNRTINAPHIEKPVYRWLMLIVLLGAALRLCGLATPGLWYDEGATLGQSQEIDATFRFFSIFVISDPPALATLVHVWREIISVIPILSAIPLTSAASDFLIHLVPCLFSILTIPLTFLVCRDLFKDNRASLFAALFCAVSPFQVFYAQELKAYSLYLAIWLGIFHCFLQALEKDTLRHWVGLVLLETLSMYTHFFSTWNILAINLFFALTLYRPERKLLKWGVAQGIACLAMLPAVILAFKWSIIYNAISNEWNLPPDFRTPMITFKAFFAGYSAHSLAYWSLFAIAVSFCALGLVRSRKSPRTLLLIVLLTVFPVAANIAIWRVREFPFYEHRIFITSAVICYCLAAYGLSALSRATWRAVALTAFCGCTSVTLYDYYVQDLHPMVQHRMGARYKVETRQAAQCIAGKYQPGDYVAHASHFSLLPIRHYLPRIKQYAVNLSEAETNGFLCTVPNDRIWQHYEIVPLRLEATVLDKPRVWFVESWWEPAETPDFLLRMRAWLDAHLVRTGSWEYDGIRVYLFENPAVLRPETRINRIADSPGDNVLQYLPPADPQAASWAERARLQTQTRLEKVLASSLPGLHASLEVKLENGTLTVIPPNLVDAPARIPVGLKDTSGVEREISIMTYACAHAITPQEFTATDLKYDNWTLGIQHWGDGFPAGLGPWGLATRLTIAHPEAAPLFKETVLPSGGYTVFAWVLRTGDANNLSRATAEFRHASAQGAETTPIGSITPNEPGAPFGWTWLRVGELQSDGRPIRIEVGARNAAQLPNAYFDMGEVIFLAHAPGAVQSRFPSWTSTMKSKPGENQHITLRVPLLSDMNPRAGVFLRDIKTNESRQLSIYANGNPF